mgnify:CR=1 FL=1
MANQGWRQVLVESAAAGTAITAASETSMIPAAQKYTLPANYFYRIGQMMKITACGIISSVITTPGTARFKVKFGATIAFDGLAVLLDSVAAHTNVGWWLDIWLQLTTTGTSAALFGWGRWTCEDILGVPATAPKGCLTAFLPWNSAPAAGATWDSTATQVIDLTFTQTAASGSLQCQSYVVESLN